MTRPLAFCGFVWNCLAVRSYGSMPKKLPDEVALRKLINLRATADERARVARFAAAQGLSVSELLRQALRDIGALPGGDAARA